MEFLLWIEMKMLGGMRIINKLDQNNSRFKMGFGMRFK
jgi:hypothetical protein